jgi:hypothetical protein
MGSVDLLAREAAQLRIVIMGMTTIYSLDTPKLRLFLASLEDDELNQLRAMGAVDKIRFLQRLFDAHLSHPSGRC